MPHAESIANLIKSDCLLLVVDESKESEEIVPGKVYEYIGVRKPIIAIGPVEGAVGRLIKSTNAGFIAHQNRISEIEEIYLNYYTEWQNGTLISNSDESQISKYERKNAAKYLAELLDEISK